MNKYVLLLPPSEGKSDTIPPSNPGWKKIHTNKKSNHFPILDDKRLELIAALQQFKKKAAQNELEELFELRGKNLDRAVGATRNLLTAPTIHAYKLYTGVVYDNIGANSLPDEALHNLITSAFVVSGLWGLIRLDDPLPDYKLKISGRFGEYNVAKYWTHEVSKLINDISKNKFVWDLLPNEHRKVWNDKGNTATHIASVKFVVESGGKYKVIGHTAKAAKGQLVREIVLHNIDSIEKFKSHNFENMKIADIITKGNKSEIVIVVG